MKVPYFLLVLMIGLARSFIGEDGIEATRCVRESYKELMTGVPNEVYLGLHRHTPSEVGEEKQITIENKTYTMIARAVHPPIYEIPNYLTDEECDKIISIAKNKGMQLSKVFGSSSWETLKKIYFSHNTQDINRVSSQTWVPMVDGPEEEPFLSKIQDRLVGLTKIPKRFIQQSEAMQVVKYLKGHHYHAHYDSSHYDAEGKGKITRKQYNNLPCCHQYKCQGSQLTCCVLCRYITVMYYLSDVEEGGETAFINAKVNKSRVTLSSLYNLSKYCSNATLRLKPKKGTAVLWYNNEIDRKTGWLGETDLYSCHGGCDVIKGVKWIGNNWLNVPKYNCRHYSSKYRHKYTQQSIWSKLFKPNTYIDPVFSAVSNVYNNFVSVKNALFANKNA